MSIYLNQMAHQDICITYLPILSFLGLSLLLSRKYKLTIYGKEKIWKAYIEIHFLASMTCIACNVGSLERLSYLFCTPRSILLFFSHSLHTEEKWSFLLLFTPKKTVSRGNTRPHRIQAFCSSIGVSISKRFFFAVIAIAFGISRANMLLK